MTLIETTILDLLKTSSLPEVYKLMIKNLLKQMSKKQKEELLRILLVDQKNIKEINNKKMAIYRKYAPVFDSISEDLDKGRDIELNPIILNFIKTNEEKG